MVSQINVLPIENKFDFCLTENSITCQMSINFDRRNESFVKNGGLVLRILNGRELSRERNT